MLSHLGDAQLAFGHPQQARDSWRQALALLEGSHDPGASGVRAKLRRLAPAEGRGAGAARSRALPEAGRGNGRGGSLPRSARPVTAPAASLLLAGAEGGPDAD